MRNCICTFGLKCTHYKDLSFLILSLRYIKKETFLEFSYYQEEPQRAFAIIFKIFHSYLLVCTDDMCHYFQYFSQLFIVFTDDMCQYFQYFSQLLIRLHRWHVPAIFIIKITFSNKHFSFNASLRIFAIYCV